MPVGKVYLVGAGPGDPGLLTVKGRDCIASADAIVYDRLLSPRILTYAKPSVACYYVGKAASDHELPQSEIESLLIRLAADGKRVVRLKGGDPFVFGRGAEEAIALRAAGIPWEVVPGITSAVSVPAYAGIPVTHRDLAPAFTVVTGHRYRTGTEMDAHLRVMDVAQGTLIILMGVGQLPQIVERLRAAGRPADTPIALIRWGTRAAHRTLTGDLETIVNRVRESNFTSPAVIVVGEVVRLRTELDWFEQLPYAGMRGLVLSDTQSEGDAAIAALASLGVEGLDLSVEAMVESDAVEVKQCMDAFFTIIEASVGGLGSVDGTTALWFKTKTGVARFVAEVADRKVDTRRLHTIRIGAQSEDVAGALRHAGLWVDWVGPKQSAPDRVRSVWAEWTDSEPTGDTGYPLYLYDATHPHGASETFSRWISEGVDFVWVTSQVAKQIAQMHGLCPTEDDASDRPVWFCTPGVYTAAEVCRMTAERIAQQVVTL